jgi:hypothetical protein
MNPCTNIKFIKKIIKFSLPQEKANNCYKEKETAILIQIGRYLEVNNNWKETAIYYLPHIWDNDTLLDTTVLESIICRIKTEKFWEYIAKKPDSFFEIWNKQDICGNTVWHCAVNHIESEKFWEIIAKKPDLFFKSWNQKPLPWNYWKYMMDSVWECAVQNIKSEKFWKIIAHRNNLLLQIGLENLSPIYSINSIKFWKTITQKSYYGNNAIKHIKSEKFWIYLASKDTNYFFKSGFKEIKNYDDNNDDIWFNIMNNITSEIFWEKIANKDEIWFEKIFGKSRIWSNAFTFLKSEKFWKIIANKPNNWLNNQWILNSGWYGSQIYIQIAELFENSQIMSVHHQIAKKNSEIIVYENFFSNRFLLFDWKKILKKSNPQKLLEVISNKSENELKKIYWERTILNINSEYFWKSIANKPYDWFEKAGWNSKNENGNTIWEIAYKHITWHNFWYHLMQDINKNRIITQIIIQIENKNRISKNHEQDFSCTTQ